MVKGSRPDRRQALGISGRARGGYLLPAAAIAWICAGVVPQQPPTMFKKPEAANSSTTTAISAGVSSYSPKAFGRPALGCADLILIETIFDTLNAKAAIFAVQ